MRIKLTYVFFLAYLILVSLITNKIQFIPFGLFIAVVLLKESLIKDKVWNDLENLFLLVIGLVPFPYILPIFLIYLPFAVFGLLFAKRSFIKNYIFGFAISFLPTILIYNVTNYLNLRLNLFLVAMFFYIPTIITIYLSIRKGKGFEFLQLSSREYFIALSITLAVVFVVNNIVNDYSLFMSNGTHQYSKFNLIVKSARAYERFPIYDPASQSGEAQFLFEAPLMFSQIAFANILLPFVQSVMFFNAYSAFILLISTISLSLLIRSVLGGNFEGESLKALDIAIVILGSVSIGLNFLFVQLLESFKQFTAFPINYLIFSTLLARPKMPREVVAIFYLILLTFIIHAPHGVGIVLMASSLIFLMIVNRNTSKDFETIKSWVWNNKLKTFLVLLLLICMPLFYITSTLIFKDFLEDHEKTDWRSYPLQTMSYYRDFIFYNFYISLKNPDINRIDDHKFGPIISLFGLLSLVFLLFLYRLKSLFNFRLFFGAYILHFLISSVIINIPMISSMEYNYRTAYPYLLIILVISMCAVIALVRNTHIKIFLTVMLLLSVIYVLPLAKKNIENIHREEFISGKWYGKEIDFVKSLPQDGRIITYGMFANAIDTGMATLTDRYFSRYHLTEVARSRTIYAKIHSEHSFGQTDSLLAMSGTELSNYLRLGGYKYVFLDVRHPIGNFVASRIYPNFSYPVYQNQALLFFVVNNTNYAEKISVMDHVDEGVYKSPDGYKYVTLSRYLEFGGKISYSGQVIEPQGLQFSRISPTEVKIYGQFSENDWVTFKETYFSRWKAYMNDREVPVMASNHDLILINTTKGDTITLQYNVLPIEKFFGMLSMVSGLILILIFLFSILA